MNDTSIAAIDFTTTSVWSKVSCDVFYYPWHIATGYFMVIAGFVCFATRLPWLAKWRWVHLHSGRVFMLSYLWCTASSLLITRTGIPRPILFFMFMMLVAATVGWYAIRVAAVRWHAARLRRADELAALASAKRGGALTPSQWYAAATDALANEPRPWHRRLFSLKALHGVCMAIAWMQMFGQTIAAGDFTDWAGCDTTFVWKERGPNGELRLVEDENPNWIGKENEPYFAAGIFLPTSLFFVIFGVVWSCVAPCVAKRTAAAAGVTDANEHALSTALADAANGGGGSNGAPPPEHAPAAAAADDGSVAEAGRRARRQHRHHSQQHRRHRNASR